MIDRAPPQCPFGLMSRILRSLAPLLFLTTVAGAEHAPTGPLPGVSPPLLLQLEGVVSGTQHSAEGRGFTTASFGFLGSDARQWLARTHAPPGGGGHTLRREDALPTGARA